MGWVLILEESVMWDGLCSDLDIRLIHKISIIGTTTRQPLLTADRECNCWFFFISNKFNDLLFDME